MINPTQFVNSSTMTMKHNINYQTLNSKFKMLYNSFVHYHPLSNKQHIRNQRHIKIQAKVEFPFQGVKHQ